MPQYLLPRFLLFLILTLFLQDARAVDWPPTTTISRAPLSPPPYLTPPPKVIPIDVGRQLFVDDYLVEKSTLTRTPHFPEYYAGNPVLTRDKVWDKDHAAPFSDGVWFDAKDGVFKMFYWARGDIDGKPRVSTCLATSRDGLHWEKPALDVVPGTNIVLLEDPALPRNSATVWLDAFEKDPARRFKMFQNLRHKEAPGVRGGWHLRASFSPDGIHWTAGPDSDVTADRSTVFYNPFRRVWVASLRKGDNVVGRFRGYHESPTVEGMLRWEKPKGDGLMVDWISADELDPDRGDLQLRRTADRPWDLPPSQLYNLDCVAYESVLLGLFSIWRGQQMPPLPKVNEVCVGYSRDGFHWSRPERRAFCPLNLNQPGWNAGNLQSVGGCCLVVKDQLYFYVGAVPYGSRFADPGNVGLAILRRDGFTSLNAAATPGELITRPVSFSGGHFFVNVKCPSGELRVEAQDETGRAIEPFTLANCEPVRADSTRAAVHWKGAADLSALHGKPVKFRFQLTSGQLYAFWVSSDPKGASHGYLGAGGPGYASQVDAPTP